MGAVNMVNFKGWNDTFALFDIKQGVMENEQILEKIIVCHQGNWTTEDAMNCHPQFEKYEDVQAAMGHGLHLIKKYFLPDKNRTCFEYRLLEKECMLVVPATGEEIDFEIYGLGFDNQKNLLLKREL